MVHLMVDIETLSLANNAVVTQIGAVTFDIVSQDFILDQYSGHLEISTQVEMGRHMDPSTVLWWLEQNEAARMEFVKAKRFAPEQILQEFCTRFDWQNIQGVWSHGLNFDIPILESLFKTFKMKTPWHYRTPRDTRTLFWLAGGVKPEGHVVAHSAVDDCIAQAKAVQKAWGILHANG